MNDHELRQRAVSLSDTLRARGATVATAESCTGGWIAKVLTDLAGSSAVFTDGFITYSNAAKSRRLGVDAELIVANGAVSETVVRAMASNARDRSGSNYAVAVSGVAGPGGGSAEKPVGTVWIAWALSSKEVHATRYQFNGDRDAVRRLTVATALEQLHELIKK